MKASLRVDRPNFSLELALEVEPGETLALLGPNGAGKSTALAALAGLVPSIGEITVNGRALDALPTEKRRIGYVFQHYLLFPHLTVLDNVAFASTRPVAREWLERFDIAQLANSHPRELSGGQAQRVALARALASGPEVLLLDEPLAALDVEVRDDVREQLAEHLRGIDVPTIVVTHSFDDVVALAKNVVVIEAGRVTQRATVRELIRDPATPYVRKLVAAWAED